MRLRFQVWNAQHNKLSVWAVQYESSRAVLRFSGFSSGLGFTAVAFDTAILRVLVWGLGVPYRMLVSE